MKRFISFLLIGIMLISSSLSFAAPGDFIHTGLEKHYDVKSSSGREDLVKDLKTSDKDKFYREDEHGKYINVYAEEVEQNRLLKEFLKEQNVDLTDPNAVTKFFQDPESLKQNGEAIISFQQSLIDATAGLGKPFNHIKIGDKDISEYPGNSSNTLKLIAGKNYSIPVAGSKEGTIQFEELNSFNSSSKWLYEIIKTGSPKFPTIDEEIKDGTVYIAGGDIDVEADDSIMLYATDLRNRVKGYALVKVRGDMIKEAATNITDTDSPTITPGKKIANAIDITGLKEGNWTYFIRTDKLPIFVDSKFDGEDVKTFLADTDIPVVSDSTIVDKNFKRFIYLINRDKNTGKIEEYIVNEISKDILSRLPEKLVQAAHYDGPEPGDVEATTSFSDLKVYENWVYKIGNDIKTPIANSKLDDTFIDYDKTKEIKAEVGAKLMLAAVDADKKIIAYEIFTLNESHISGKTPETFNVILEKGSQPGTTKVKSTDLPEDTKLKYAIGKDIAKPYLNRLYEGSKDYTLGKDIIAKLDDTLYIFAVDGDGRVLKYAKAELNGMIKDPLADEIKETLNYQGPVKGSDDGTTKFTYLNYGGADSYYYKISDKPIAIPEKNILLSNIVGTKKITISQDGKYTADKIEILEKDDPTLKDENGFTRYMIVYAVKGDNVIAATYENFKMTPSNVSLPKAVPLPWQLFKDKEDSEPLKYGQSANSTTLKKLTTAPNNLSYKYKFVDKNFIPEINQVIRPVSNLESGKELKAANIGDYLLILAVDNRDRTKYYAKIELTDTNTRAGDAKPLIPLNYKNPEPGTEFNSTRFEFLSFNGIQGADQFMIATSKTPFKAVEFDSIVTGAVEYATVDENGTITYVVNPDENKTKTDIKGNILGVDPNNNRHLLLLATDNAGKVKAYKYFPLTDINIRGDKANDLKPLNYNIEKGSDPGTIKFNKLSNLGVGNNTWMYKWAATDVFTSNPPFIGQVITDATTIRVNRIDANTSKGLDNIKVEKQSDVGTPDDHKYGHILLLATNGDRVAGYTVIEVTGKDVQSTADVLNIELKKGSVPDSTEITGDDKDKAKKYIISTTPLEQPGPNADLPRSGVKNVPANKEISVTVGEHLRIFNVDGKDKIIGFKDFTIIKDLIKQGTAVLSILGVASSEPVLEGTIKAKAIKIQVKLTDADWANVVSNGPIKNALLDGIKAYGVEQDQWKNVIQKIKDDKYSISENNGTITITTTATADYDISEDQNITLSIPAIAIKGAINPIEAEGNIVIRPTIDAKISGSVVNNIRQSEINSGKATIIIDIVDSKWSDNIETNENKTSLINGFTSDGDENSPWNKETTGLKALIETNKTTNVNLKGSSRIEITIPGNQVKIDHPETITLEIPSGLVDGENLPIIAAPSFIIYPDILPITGSVDEAKKVILEAPNFINPLVGQDTWIIKLEGDISFRDDFLVTRDISTSSLPSGLKLDITKTDSKQLEIKLVGKTNKALQNGEINLVIKSTAISEKSYIDSENIKLPYTQGGKVDLRDVTYNIESSGIYLVINSPLNKEEIEYNINYKKGSSYGWEKIPENLRIKNDLEDTTIYVREIKQKDNIQLVGELKNPAAPTDIKIDKYEYSKDGDNLTVNLNKPEDLEYSLGKPNDWKGIIDNEISLNKDSILSVRKKVVPGTGEDSSLPSLPTPKLNGIFLGNVKLDVSQSKILGADRDMKYRLSSDETASWNNISTKDPTVDFKDGNNVWISESKDEKNKRPLGPVTQAKISVEEKELIVKVLIDEDLKDESKIGIYYHIGGRKIVNKTGVNLQYNITKGAVPKGNWYNLKALAEDVNFIPGNVFIRKVDDGNSLPSNPIKLFEIAEAIAPPKIEVNQDNKTLLYETSGGTYEKLDPHFEYKIDNGDYQSGDLLEKDPKRFGNVKVYVKRKATKDLLPSKEVSFTLTENISLANVQVNVAKGIIEGTTSKMEYRTDANSPWKIASNGRTEINMYEGMNIWIREAGTTSTSKMILEDLKKMNKPKADKLPYDVSQKFIKNTSKVILEYRINNDSWNTINVGQTISIEFVPTKLSIRTKATVDMLASDMVNVMENDLKYPVEAPEIKIDDKDNTVISIDKKASDIEWDKYEFKLKSHTEWMPGNNLKTYDLSGDKVVQIRIRGTSTILPSEIREVIFTKNIYVQNVELRTTAPLQLVGTEPEMEYQIYLTGQLIPNTWIKASAGTTNLDSKIKEENIKLIVVRDSRDMSRNVDEYKLLIGSKEDFPVDLSEINYDITDTNIVFTGLTNRIRYKSSSNSQWQTGDKDTSVSYDLDVMEITVEDNMYPSITRTITVSERAETPGVTVSKVDYIGAKMTLTLDNFIPTDSQYSFDGGLNWNNSSSSTFPITKGGTLHIRAKAIKTEEGKVGSLPSLPTKDLNPTSLIDVGVSMDKGKTKLINTTKFMEYNLDSKDAKDDDWTTAGDKETSVDLKLDSTIWIREINNPGNTRRIELKGQEGIPVFNDSVFFNITKGKIANFNLSQDLEYRMAGGDWIPVNIVFENSMVAYDVDFKPGPLEFRRAATESKFASEPIVLTTIQIAGSAPKMESNDIDNKISLPNDKENYQYRVIFNGVTGQWTPSSNLVSEDLTGEKVVEIRKIATTKYLPSNIQIIKFTNNKLKQVNLSSHVKPLELNGTTNKMEYRINGLHWQICIPDKDGYSKLLRNDKKTDLNDIKDVNIIEVRYTAPDQQHNIFTVYEKPKP